MKWFKVHNFNRSAFARVRLMLGTFVVVVCPVNRTIGAVVTTVRVSREYRQCGIIFKSRGGTSSEGKKGRAR
jgi:hypothetical protein